MEFILKTKIIQRVLRLQEVVVDSGIVIVILKLFYEYFRSKQMSQCIAVGRLGSH